MEGHFTLTSWSNADLSTRLNAFEKSTVVKENVEGTVPHKLCYASASGDGQGLDAINGDGVAVSWWRHSTSTRKMALIKRYGTGALKCHPYSNPYPLSSLDTLISTSNGKSKHHGQNGCRCDYIHAVSLK
ncbi:hypothetical protein Tco_0914790, partial [Tanacetum coccineum]